MIGTAIGYVYDEDAMLKDLGRLEPWMKRSKEFLFATECRDVKVCWKSSNEAALVSVSLYEHLEVMLRV